MQTAQPLTLAEAILPRLPGESRALLLARELVLLIGGAAFIAVFAQIAVRTPWTEVPITGQTFAVLTAGGALGAWRGAGATTLYAIAGSAGLPFFAPAADVTAGRWDLHFVLPWAGSHGQVWDLVSGGYVVGFILAAALVGFLAERRWDRGAWVHVAMLLGNAVLYIPGLWWLGYKLDTSFSRTLELGLYPFIVGDLMKLLLAASVLPGAWLLVERVKGRTRGETGQLRSRSSAEARGQR